MLTGRESLIRLIGKRRRIHPDRQSLLLSDHEVLSRKDENGEGSSSNPDADRNHGGDNNDEKTQKGFVTCPVCGNTVRGSDYDMNNHLDVCLARGTKRKMTQRTLLQFSFSAASNEKTRRLGDVGTGKALGGVDADPEIDTVVRDEYRTQCTSRLDSVADLEGIEGVLVGDIMGEDVKEDEDEDELDAELCRNDDTSMEVLQTFIVGRRFGDEVELKIGDPISLLRDANNAKDPNAIKVLLSDSSCTKVLGYLPRELARYLSPLIDTYSLVFEGKVMSIPENSRDIVPIQIMCRELSTMSEKDSDDHQVLNPLWKNVLHIVKCTQGSPPDKPKYQHNFRFLIEEVMRNHHHLFTDDEKLFIESYSSLSDNSQRLFIRLYTRKGPWFRMSNISYREVVDSKQAIEGLLATGYICTLDSLKILHENDVKDVLDMLTVPELRDILKLTHSKKGISATRKQELISLLLASYKDVGAVLCQALLNQIGTCVRISSTAEFLLWRVQRLFFLNGEQDLSSFIMVDLGVVKYPDYNCIISNKVFPSRCDLLSYEKALEVAQIMDQSLDDDNTDSVKRCIEISDRFLLNSRRSPNSSILELDGTFRSFFSPSWVYSKVITLGVSFLEREHRYEDAIRLLKQLLHAITCGGRRGYWTVRLSIDLEHVGQLNESLSVAEEGLLDPWVRAGSKMALQMRVLRLGKPPRRWKTPSFSKSIKRKIKEVHIVGRPLNCDLGIKNRFYGEDGEQCSVEQLALQHYAGEGGGWQGVHSESGIWMTLFGILMWDVIFADVPDVFHTKFQTFPLDLETDQFYLARKSLIESHLQKIYDGIAEEILIMSWESHNGTACRGVSWDRHSLSELRAAVTCVGGPCLASLFRLLAQDYRSWSRGMPDLFLWRFVGAYRGEAKLVEVKGPRDRLSEQQRAWLLLLMDCGFSTEVCKVSPEMKSPQS